MRFSKRQHRRQSRDHHSPEETSLPPSPAAKDPDASLRKKIQGFAFQPRFGQYLDSALGQFFGSETVRTRQISADNGDIADFQEWMFNDYLLPSGETIIELFAREIGPQLPSAEHELLDAHRRWNRYRLFEVEKVMPGKGIIATDLLSGEEWEIHDYSASRHMQQWAILLARPTYTGRLHFTGGSTILSPTKKQAVVAYGRQLLADFQAEHPGATVDDFYRRHGFDIRQFMHKKAQERPLLITPEGHPLEDCKARYSVKSARAVTERLDDTEEFQFAGPSTDAPGAITFNWLLRGRSHVPEHDQRPDGETLTFITEWISEDDSKIRFRNLGDVVVWSNRLELLCVSRPRLQAGKSLLESVAGDLIRHRSDHFEPISEASPSKRAKTPLSQSRRSSRPDAKMEVTDRNVIEESLQIWCDTSLEALGGRTPREAVHDPDGRTKVIEMLKVIEYHQIQARQSGEQWYDVNLIRRDLGLPEN